MRKQLKKFGLFSSNSDLNKIQIKDNTKKGSETPVKNKHNKHEHKKERHLEKQETKSKARKPTTAIQEKNDVKDDLSPWPFNEEGYLIEKNAHAKHINRKYEHELSKRVRKYHNTYSSVDNEFYFISPAEIKKLKKKLLEAPDISQKRNSNEHKRKCPGHNSFDETIKTIKKLEKISDNVGSAKEKHSKEHKHQRKQREAKSCDNRKHVDKSKLRERPKTTDFDKTSSVPIKTLFVFEKKAVPEHFQEISENRREVNDDSVHCKTKDVTKKLKESAKGDNNIEIERANSKQKKKHSKEKLSEHENKKVENKIKSAEKNGNNKQTFDSPELQSLNKPKQNTSTGVNEKPGKDKHKKKRSCKGESGKKSQKFTSSSTDDQIPKKPNSMKRRTSSSNKKCKIETMTSIIDIQPETSSKPHVDNLLEKKKESATFKKYYELNYIAHQDPKNDIYLSLSDSNKIYLGCSDQSESSISTIEKKKNQFEVLQQVFNVRKAKESSHEINVVTDFAPQKEDSDIKKNEKTKFGIYRSKIPIPNINNSKFVESSKDCKQNSHETDKGKISGFLKALKMSYSKLQPDLKVDQTKDQSSEPLKEKDSNNTRCIQSKIDDSKSTASDKPEIKKSNGNMDTIQKKSEKMKTEKDKCVFTKSKSNSIRTRNSKIIGNKSKISDNSSCSSKNIGSKTRSVKSAKIGDTPKKIFGRINSAPPSKKPMINKQQSLKPNQKTESKVIKTSNNKEQKSIRVPPLKTNNKQSMSLPRNFNSKKERSVSPQATYRKKSEDVVVRNRASTSINSSEGSRKSKTVVKSKPATPKSKSEIKVDRPSPIKKNFERSSTKGSLSNSTSPACSIGDKSTDSSKNQTSFLLTKNYNDEEKLNRWKKRKMYADIVRQNLINKNQNFRVPQPQMMEVRFLTVELNETRSKNLDSCQIEEIFDDVQDKHQVAIKSVSKLNKSNSKIESQCKTSNDGFDKDLPNCVELLPLSQFNEMFESTLNGALEDIMHENYNFLKKDFSLDLPKISRLEDDISDNTSRKSVTSQKDKASDESVEWHDFVIEGSDDILYSDNLKEYCHPHTSKYKETTLNLNGHEGKVTDSYSAPGSEESGYSTIKTRKKSSSVFERSEVTTTTFLKASPRTFSDISLLSRKSSICSLDICTAECVSFQTQTHTPKYSQKSVQIKISGDKSLEVPIFPDSKVSSIVSEDKEQIEINTPQVTEEDDGNTPKENLSYSSHTHYDSSESQETSSILQIQHNLSFVTFYPNVCVAKEKKQSWLKRVASIFKKKKQTNSAVLALPCVTENKD